MESVSSVITERFTISCSWAYILLELFGWIRTLRIWWRRYNFSWI